jgi:STE24 endopeptidase
MLPLQFIFLLLIVFLPRELAEAGANSSAPPPALNLLSAPLAYAALLLTQAGGVWFVFIKTRRAIRLLHEPSSSASAITGKTDALFMRARLAASLITGACLFSTRLAPTLQGWFDGTRILRYLLVPEILYVLPAVLAWLAIWTASYYVEEAMRRRSLPYELAQAMPVHDLPSLGSYLTMQVRHNFYPALFLPFQGLVDALNDGLARVTHTAGNRDTAQSIATIGCIVLVLLALPFLLTRFWSTTTLPGALRRRLDGVAERYGLRFRDIRLWRTHNMILNAAIVGWFPRARYFLMTDTLVESLSDRQLEAVFAHEVGHGIHRHLPWMMVAILSVAALATGVTVLAVALLPFSDQATRDMASLAISSGLLCLFGVAAIGWISPRFEHQADWFACRHMALRLRQSPEPAVEGAAEPLPAALEGALAATATPAERVTVTQYVAGAYPHNPKGAGEAVEGGPTGGVTPNPEVAGAEIFISSLDAIVEVSHRDRGRRGLFHPSAAKRMALLRRLALDPAAEARFNRKLRRVRWVIVLLAAASVATFGAALLREGASAAPAGDSGAAVAVPAPMP